MWRLILYILSFQTCLNAFSQDFNLEGLLKNIKNPVFEKVMQNPDKYRIQILYSRPTKTGFKEYSYRVNANEYFYPASLAKLPLCVLTYDKINTLNKGLAVDQQLLTTSPYAPPSKYIRFDTTTQYLSLKDHIIRCFVVSDNNSPNYLYEFLGHKYINTRLKELNFGNIKINQRFSKADTLQNRITGAVKLINAKGDTLLHQKADTSQIRFSDREIVMGKRYLDKGKIVYKPFPFTLENNIPLAELHQLWKEVCYPKHKTKLKLSLENKLEIKEIASILPDQSVYPNFYHFADNYRKFLFYGDTACKIPSHIQIANKVGLAYGFISDISYFKDHITGIEFSLSAVMFTNDNETFNDGRYEYNTVGLPFLGKLGRVIYDYELYMRSIGNRDIRKINENLKYSFSLRKVK